MKFFILGRDDSISSSHSMPNTSVGETEALDDPLKKLIFAKDKKNMLVPFKWKNDSKIIKSFSSS